MAIEIISDIIPKNSGSFPIADVENIRGAWRSVSGISERDAIPTSHRREGLTVFVSGTTQYRLVGGITNSDWVADGNLKYTHSQSSASTGWDIQHNMGYNPNIVCIASGGIEVMGSISYPTPSSVARVSFNQPYAGTGYCS